MDLNSHRRRPDRRPKVLERSQDRSKSSIATVVKNLFANGLHQRVLPCGPSSCESLQDRVCEDSSQFTNADDNSQGNLLIRPKAPKSKSPFNFDIVLLDHGQYFDLDDDLRVNYARFWLSLISPETPKNLKKRKHYAKLVANVGDDLV